MVDALQLIKDFGPHVLTGVSGFAGAAYRFHKRIESLIKKVSTLDKRLTGYATQQSQIGQQLVDVVKRLEILERYEVESKIRKQIDDLKLAMKLEIDNHRDDLETMIVEVRSSIRSVENSSHDFAKEAALAQFVTQQHQRWETIQRTLGRIEGFLKRNDRDD